MFPIYWREIYCHMLHFPIHIIPLLSSKKNQWAIVIFIYSLLRCFSQGLLFSFQFQWQNRLQVQSDWKPHKPVTLYTYILLLWRYVCIYILWLCWMQVSATNSNLKESNSFNDRWYAATCFLQRYTYFSHQ